MCRYHTTVCNPIKHQCSTFTNGSFDIHDCIFFHTLSNMRMCNTLKFRKAWRPIPWSIFQYSRVGAQPVKVLTVKTDPYLSWNWPAEKMTIQMVVPNSDRLPWGLEVIPFCIIIQIILTRCTRIIEIMQKDRVPYWSKTSQKYIAKRVQDFNSKTIVQRIRNWATIWFGWCTDTVLCLLPDLLRELVLLASCHRVS